MPYFTNGFGFDGYSLKQIFIYNDSIYFFSVYDLCRYQYAGVDGFKKQV